MFRAGRAGAGQPHGLRQPQLHRSPPRSDSRGISARRDEDALGDDPVTAYAGSVRACAAAFAEEGALDRVVDYPLGTDETLDPDLVAWIDEDYATIFAGLGPGIFAEPPPIPPGASRQERLLTRFGRAPRRAG
ncbi:hypothetical protein [Amycolatopsis sp. NPDC003861]